MVSDVWRGETYRLSVENNKQWKTNRDKEREKIKIGWQKGE
jgi:hypothetical protein